MRDPFYNSIIQRLNGQLDPRVFEVCAADLINKDFPVVPIPGGDDPGMDRTDKFILWVLGTAAVGCAVIVVLVILAMVGVVN